MYDDGRIRLKWLLKKESGNTDWAASVGLISVPNYVIVI
jgi:hypothetical protein